MTLLGAFLLKTNRRLFVSFSHHQILHNMWQEVIARELLASERARQVKLLTGYRNNPWLQTAQLLCEEPQAHSRAAGSCFRGTTWTWSTPSLAFPSQHWPPEVLQPSLSYPAVTKYSLLAFLCNNHHANHGPVSITCTSQCKT